jgi:hypothetical protein
LRIPDNRVSIVQYPVVANTHQGSRSLFKPSSLQKL